MNHSDYRIPDDMASEILAEAARLKMKSSQGYSREELEQAGSEVQIPPEIVRQAIKIVEGRRQAKQMKWRRARDQFKQQIKKYTSIGVPLCILFASVSGILILLPSIGKLIKLPDLQRQIQTLETEKQQTQANLDKANQQLKRKDEEINQLQQGNSKTLREFHELQQEMRRSKSLDDDPETGIMFRDSFTKAVIKQTKHQVIQAVGKPDRTSDSGEYSHWYYDEKTKDRITGNVDSSISIFFVNGVADKVSNY